MALERFGGFETADFSDAQAVTGAAAVVTSPVKTGGRALRLQPNATRQTVEYALAAGATKSIACWVRVEMASPPASQTQTSIIRLINLSTLDSGGMILLRVNTDGTAELVSGRFAGGTSETVIDTHVSIATNTWHLVELLVVSHVSAGRVAWRLNGVEQNDTGAAVNTGGADMTEVVFRAMTTTWTDGIFFDNWAVRDDAAYPGDHRVILRKVKAGSPTYDAFTKASAGTIDAEWADVPFSATSNAQSTDADQAQTALVEDVATGTDPIGASDTINGCTTAMIAKKV